MYLRLSVHVRALVVMEPAAVPVPVKDITMDIRLFSAIAERPIPKYDDKEK